MRRFWPLTFRARLTVRWTLVFGVLLAAANASIYVAVRAYAYADLDSKVRTLGVTEVASAVDGPVGLHVHELPIELANGAYTEKFVQVFDAGGRLVAASTMLAGAGPLVSRDLIEAGLAERAPVANLTVNGRPVRVVVLKASRDGLPYAVAVGLFADDLEAALAKLSVLLIVIWVAGLAATAGAGFALASTALRPVQRITERAASIARGDFAGRLDPPMLDDEIGRMTRTLNELLERLHAAIDANRRFASDASHELRGPITAMTGEIDVTLRYERSADEYRETLQVVRERLSSLAALTEALMLLVRAQEARAHPLVQEIELGPALASAANRAAALARGRDVTIVLEDAPPLAAYGDPRLLARVFDNVIDNAVRYNRDGGWVTIRARFEETDDVDAWRAGTTIVEVADTGPGVPLQDRDRIFERFYRVDQSRARHTGGTGLGLAICREVLTLFGGAIRIASSSPQGTTVEIRIPGAVTAQAALRPAEANAQPDVLL